VSDVTSAGTPCLPLQSIQPPEVTAQRIVEHDNRCSGQRFLDSAFPPIPPYLSISHEHGHDEQAGNTTDTSSGRRVNFSVWSRTPQRRWDEDELGRHLFRTYIRLAH